MKKLFIFLFSVIILIFCCILACMKLGLIDRNEIKSAFNIISTKTKNKTNNVGKKIGNKIEQTKSDIKEQIKEQLEKQPRDVKIIATLGKEGWKNIPSFCENGANIFRINGSHIKSDKQLQETLEGVNQYINDKKCSNAEIMYDTQGPEIRILINEKIKKNVKNKKKKIEPSYIITTGDNIVVHTNLKDRRVNFVKDPIRHENNAKTIHVGVNYKEFLNDVKEGMVITIENRNVYAKVDTIDKENGLVKLIVNEVDTKDRTYKLTNKRHINLIGKPVSQETLTKEDEKYIKMSALNGVKYYAISFARSKNDIQEVRNIIKQAFIEENKNLSEEELNDKMKKISIIAKIETQQGIDNLNEIVDIADGAMVARGDLGSEIPMEEVPYATYKIINTCNKKNKFSILATDVLLSLTQQHLASRNDIYVIASTLNLGVSSIMLSNETAQCEEGGKAIAELKKHIKYYNTRKANKDFL